MELSDKNIQFITLSRFKKSSFNRIIARWQVFNYYIQLKPELIIVNSPDLLIFSLLYRIIFGAKIIYDIQENYFRNLWYQNNYRWGLKHALAILVRAKEIIAAPLFNHFFLAEKVYSNQLNFIRNKFTILENKSLVPEKINSSVLNKTSPKFLVSGTIAYEYGILEAIKFFKSIKKIYPKATLIIIGHCPNKLLYIKLELIHKSNPSIKLKISSDPIPHAHIKIEILQADIGLMPYLPNESTQGKWPTKVYEYMAYKLPFILQENSVWNNYIISNNVGKPFDFINQSQEQSLSIWECLKSTTFYTKINPSEIYWSTQEAKLLSAVNNCLNN